MKKLLYISVLALTVCLTYSQVTFAVCGGGPTVFTCDTNPPNPDPDGVQQGGNANITINVLPGAGIDTVNGNGGDAIEYGGGSNEITITNANISAQNDGIDAFMNLGLATIHIEGSTMFSVQDVIDLGDVDGNIVNITNSNLTTNGAGGFSVLNGSNNHDAANISGSTLTGNDREILNLRDGEDDVSLTNTTLIQLDASEESINLEEDNDTLTIFNGVVFERQEGGREFINCGPGFDTIVFAMDVPEEQLNKIGGEITLAGLPDGSITINGLLYDWEECESLVNELNGVQNLRPIPTLSEWGLIAMAGVLGIIGLLAIQRRKASA